MGLLTVRGERGERRASSFECWDAVCGVFDPCSSVNGYRRISAPTPTCDLLNKYLLELLDLLPLV